jgi:hypothetical protein
MLRLGFSKRETFSDGRVPGSPVADFDAFSGDSNVDTGSNGVDPFKKPGIPLTTRYTTAMTAITPPYQSNFFNKTTFLLCFDLLPVPFGQVYGS